jgi:hypothetical protein
MPGTRHLHTCISRMNVRAGPAESATGQSCAPCPVVSGYFAGCTGRRAGPIPAPRCAPPGMHCCSSSSLDELHHRRLGEQPAGWNSRATIRSAHQPASPQALLGLGILLATANEQQRGNKHRGDQKIVCFQSSYLLFGWIDLRKLSRHCRLIRCHGCLCFGFLRFFCYQVYPADTGIQLYFERHLRHPIGGVGVDISILRQACDPQLCADRTRP